jgi:drug/metabolite transporter (DMT)-like permease
MLLVALIWGSAFVAQAHGMEGLGPFAFTGIRFLIGACVVAPLALRDWRALERRGARTGREVAQSVAGIGVLLTLGAVLQQIGMTATTVTHAGVLTALYVPLVPLFSWLITRVRPHASVWPASLGCFVGTWMLSGGGSLAIGVGDAWVIASSFFWALHVIFVGRVADRLAAPFLLACGQFLICGLSCIVWAAFAETISWEGVRIAALPILYTGVLSVGVAYTGQVVAQRYAAAADAAIILSAETVFAAFFGAILMGDRLSVIGWAGGALIFACIVAVQLAPLSARRAKAVA